MSGNSDLEAAINTVLFISQSLIQAQVRLLASCKGLAREQVLWRPAPFANNIGFNLWHLARSEEAIVHHLGGQQPELWESEGWHKRFGQPVEAPDPGDTSVLRDLPIPELGVLVDYLQAVHQRTLALVSELRQEALDGAPDQSRPDHTLAVSLRHLTTHKNNHHGQIDFIRGLQDDMWNATPGIGIVPPLHA
jgi:uncharacterized damage-inducible protein DinB